MTTQVDQTIAACYVAFFGRSPDQQGLQFWEAASSGLTNLALAQQVAAGFANNPSFASTYGGMGNNAFVTAIYENITGTAPDANGLQYWVNELNAGTSQADVVAQFIYGVLNMSSTAIAAEVAAGTITQAEADAATSRTQILNNKVAVALAYTSAMGSGSNMASSTNQSSLASLQNDPAYLASQSILNGVTADPTSVTAAETYLAGSPTNAGIITQFGNGTSVPGNTYTLTTGADNIQLAGSNNIVNGVLGGSTTATLTALDTITAASSSTGNILNLVDTNVAGSATGDTLPSGISVSGVQTVNVTSAGGVGSLALAFDTTAGFTGLKTLNIAKSTGADYVQVGDGTAVNVTDSATDGAAGGLVNVIATTGAVTVNAQSDVVVAGGSTQTVTTNNGAVQLSGATGNVAVTAADKDAGHAIQVNDGANVTVTDTLTSTSAGTVAETAGAITVGNTTGAATPIDTPTGTVTVVENLNDAKAFGMTGGTITVTGGTTVGITVNATEAGAAAGATTAAGTVTVNGTAATTTVSVTETAASSVTTTTKAAVAAVAQVDTVTFSNLTAGQSVTVGGLTFTASAAMTAAQVAAAFANLSATADQGAGGMVAQGTYSGVSLGGWTSGAVVTNGTSSTVQFTATTATLPIVATAVGVTAPTVAVTTTAAPAALATTTTAVIADGAVNVTDATYVSAPTAAGTISNVTLSGFNGATIDSNALTTLSLTNGAGTVAVGNNVETALALTLDNVGSSTTAAVVELGTTYTSLSINTTGADSSINLSAVDVTALAVAGSNSVNLAGSDLAALKTVTVSGSAGVTLDVATALSTHLTDINASATSGHNTVTSFDASTTTFEGGSGGDTLSLAALDPVTKAITFGSGNDTLVLGADTVSAAINGGAGVNTLSMDVVAAAGDSLSTTFATDVTNFQHLTLTGATAAATTINVAELGNYSYVTDSTDTVAGALTLSHFASGGTLVLTNTTVGDADLVTFANATVSTNTLNLELSSAGNGTAGAVAGLSDTVTVANAQSVAITANDTYAKDGAGYLTHSLALADNSTTASLTTLTITGNAALTLDTTGATAVTTVNASGDTGGLTYTTNGVVAETVTGGSGVNTLTAHSGSVADTLIGGSGANVLTSNSGLDTLTGGSGSNTFVINAPSSVNTYATITNAAAGDVIEFNHLAATSFVGTQVQLASTAVFQDYANQAVVTAAHVAAGAVTWFQFGGNTYVVEAGATTDTSFTNGTDSIVQLQGAVNLSHASFNSTTHELVIH